MSKRQTVTI